MTIARLIIKVIVSAIAIAIAAFFTPGMANEGGIWSLLVAAVIIGLLDWLISRFTNVDASPFGRGIIGFLVAAAILFVTGMMIEGFDVSPLGAIIGAAILGIVDAIMPGHKTM